MDTTSVTSQYLQFLLGGNKVATQAGPREAECVPQFVAEVPVRFNALDIQVDVLPGQLRTRNERTSSPRFDKEFALHIKYVPAKSQVT